MELLRQNKKTLIVLYPGSGDTYISKLFNEDFKIPLNIINPGHKKFGAFNKTNLSSSSFSKEELDKLNIILLVRDGRDCIVENAWHALGNSGNKIVFEKTILESIYAADGSYSDGWSKHLNSWLSVCDYIVKFEDLIKPSSKELDRIAASIGYNTPPNPIQFDKDTMGDFLRLDKPRTALQENPESWEKELNNYQKELFIKIHGDTLALLGYYKYPNLENSAIFPPIVIKKKLGLPLPEILERKILVDGSKLQMPYNDGIKRYVVELLMSFKKLSPYITNWNIEVYDGERILEISDFDEHYYLSKKKPPFYKNLFSNCTGLIKNFVGFILPNEIYNSLVMSYKSNKAKIKQLLDINLSQYFRDTNKQKSSFNDKNSGDFDVNDYDLIHIPLMQHCDLILKAKEKALITLHDLTHISHPNFHENGNILMAEQGLQLSLKNSCSFFSISENTKNDFIKVAPDAKHLGVIYEAADNTRFYPEKNKYWESNIRFMFGLKKDDVFFLSVSTLEPRKNLMSAILAFQEASPNLPDNVYFLIVGKNGWKMKESIPGKRSISKKIIFAGFVEEEFLPILYRESLALIYVSHYEGFGLPLLESISCGTPVIYGDNSSMNEIIGDSGYPAHSTDVEKIKEQILSVVNNKNLKEEKKFKSIEKSNQFTWQLTGVKTIELYNKQIEQLETAKQMKNEFV